MIAKKSVNKDNSMKRIAIFAFFGHIAKSPSTISMIETLAENGFFC